MEKDNPVYIEDRVYLASKSLIEALSAYSNTDTLKAYDESYNSSSNKSKFAPLVMTSGETVTHLDTLDNVQSNLLAQLKSQVMELIKTEMLIPYGFSMPRMSTSNPEIIPVDVFLVGDVNWDKSEITHKNTEFSGVRLIESDKQKITANNFQRSGGLVEKIKKSDKSNFSGLGPSQHLSEKDAANYLGISSRVMQGLRIKGTGPEFLKTGQAIRYKIADLNAWVNKN